MIPQRETIVIVRYIPLKVRYYKSIIEGIFISKGTVMWRG